MSAAKKKPSAKRSPIRKDSALTSVSIDEEIRDHVGALAALMSKVGWKKEDAMVLLSDCWPGR